MAHAVDEQRFDVRPQLSQDCILFNNLIPCIEWKQRLNRSSGTWVKSNDPVFQARAEKECHVDWDQQVFPLGIGHPEVSQLLSTPRNAPEFAYRHPVKKGRA